MGVGGKVPEIEFPFTTFAYAHTTTSTRSTGSIMSPSDSDDEEFELDLEEEGETEEVAVGGGAEDATEDGDEVCAPYMRPYVVLKRRTGIQHRYIDHNGRRR